MQANDGSVFFDLAKWLVIGCIPAPDRGEGLADSYIIAKDLTEEEARVHAAAVANFMGWAIFVTGGRKFVPGAEKPSTYPGVLAILGSEYASNLFRHQEEDWPVALGDNLC